MSTLDPSASRRSSAPFVAGVAVGAAVGAGWILAHKFGRGQSDQLFDWDRVTAIAVRTAGDLGSMAPAAREQVETEYQEIVREIAEPLGEYTGTGFDLSHTEVRALDRKSWIEANTVNFRHLFEPIEEVWRESARPAASGLPGVAAVGRFAVSGEMGVLMGYLARRVLGQYDITLLTQGPMEPGKLYFVEPNVDALHTHLGLPRREFRVWLALHEATHAHEFEGYPWIRPYMDQLIRDYLRSMSDNIATGNLSMVTSFGDIVEKLFKGDSILEATMTPEQHDLFLRLQALMTVLEGYATHIMSAVGQHLIPHYEQIEERVEARKNQRGTLELLFLRLTGLQLKMDQYRLGTAFVAAVERERGRDFLHRIWEGPEQLPTMDEITVPERWIKRVELVAA